MPLARRAPAPPCRPPPRAPCLASAPAAPCRQRHPSPHRRPCPALARPACHPPPGAPAPSPRPRPAQPFRIPHSAFRVRRRPALLLPLPLLGSADRQSHPHTPTPPRHSWLGFVGSWSCQSDHQKGNHRRMLPRPLPCFCPCRALPPAPPISPPSAPPRSARLPPAGQRSQKQCPALTHNPSHELHESKRIARLG